MLPGHPFGCPDGRGDVGVRPAVEIVQENNLPLSCREHTEGSLQPPSEVRDFGVPGRIVARGHGLRLERRRATQHAACGQVASAIANDRSEPEGEPLAIPAIAQPLRRSQERVVSSKGGWPIGEPVS